MYQPLPVFLYIALYMPQRVCMCCMYGTHEWFYARMRVVYACMYLCVSVCLDVGMIVCMYV